MAGNLFHATFLFFLIDGKTNLKKITKIARSGTVSSAVELGTKAFDVRTEGGAGAARMIRIARSTTTYLRLVTHR